MWDRILLGLGYLNMLVLIVATIIGLIGLILGLVQWFMIEFGL